ncbi:MAG: TetR family transcriptional regulator [Solirubrobacteraceae bacterium]
MSPIQTRTAGGEISAGSLRERKKRATREALRRAAVAQVADRGLAAVTVEDIAAAAEMSPRTFFNYFPTKEDAVSGWDPAVVAEMIDRLRGCPASEAAPVALRSMLLDVLSSSDADHRELLERLRVIRSDPRLVAHHASRWGDLERQMVSALAQRRGTDAAHDHYASLVVATMLAACRVAMMSWCDREGLVPLADELAVHLKVLGSGLAESEGAIA